MADSVRARLDDPRRIEAARRLLAQARRETLERLAALSARLLDAKHAQIALVLDAPVIITPGPTVTNGQLLEAFAEILTEPTFLAAPIDVAGDRVGVLSVQAAEPRDWTQHDAETLRELAGTVAAELERGALAAELETSTVRLDLGFAA